MTLRTQVRASGAARRPGPGYRAATLLGTALLLAGVAPPAQAGSAQPGSAAAKCYASLIGSHVADGRCDTRTEQYYVVATSCGACSCSATGGPLQRWPGWSRLDVGALTLSKPYAVVYHPDTREVRPGESRLIPGSEKC